jgi:phosphoribosylamine--glycine ligase
MKVLVIGQGGREHALTRAFTQSSSISEVHCIPGNDGIAQTVLCHNLNIKNHETIVQFCLRTEIDFVFIGPEDPLVDGLADSLRSRGILVVGPSQESAQLEGSKIFAKKFMQRALVPTSTFSEVGSFEETMSNAYQFTPPYVLKADGLAAGKGVYICKNIEELAKAANDIFVEKIFGEAGNKALLEQFMPGWELSYLILTNGSAYQSLPIAQDHKRLLDQDQGPNTGGMGTIAPLSIDADLHQQIHEKILAPSVAQLQKENLLYRGVLFVGLMITEQGPQVLEYNCRFGDPETQVILPLLQNDVGQLFKNLAEGKLLNVESKNLHAACVVLAAPGYPQKPEKDLPISGDIESQTDLSYFLHAATKHSTNSSAGKWLTNGGRVMNAVGLGLNAKQAIENAYAQSCKVQWMGLQKRSDIGKSIL